MDFSLRHYEVNLSAVQPWLYWSFCCTRGRKLNKDVRFSCHTQGKNLSRFRIVYLRNHIKSKISTVNFVHYSAYSTRSNQIDNCDTVTATTTRESKYMNSYDLYHVYIFGILLALRTDMIMHSNGLKLVESTQYVQNVLVQRFKGVADGLGASS